MTDFMTAEGLFRLLIAWLILSALGFIFGKQFTSLTKAVLLGVIGRFAIAWTVLSVLGFIYGNQLLIWSFPYVTWVINLIQDDYSGTLTIISLHDDQQIQLSATMKRSFPPFVEGNKLSTIFDTMTMDFIIPLVLLFS